MVKTTIPSNTYSSRKQYLCQPKFISVHWNSWLEVFLFYAMLLIGIGRLQNQNWFKNAFFPE